MNKFFHCAAILLSFGAAAVIPAAEPAPPVAPAGASAPAAPTTSPGAATTPAAPASPKSPSTAPAQPAGPDRIEPTEKVRADSEVSFPVDI